MKQLEAIEILFYRRMPRISWTKQVRNSKFLKKMDKKAGILNLMRKEIGKFDIHKSKIERKTALNIHNELVKTNVRREFRR